MAQISDLYKEILNRMNRSANKVQLGTVIQNISAGVVPAGSISTAELADDAVDADKLADDAVSIEQLDSGIKPVNINILAVADAETSREDNVAGLSSAIALVNEIKADFVSHAANATRHTNGVQDTSALSADADDIASIVVLSNELTTLYAAHNADAILGSSWAYHNGQAADKVLAAATAVSTLAESIVRLNDIKAKYNDHEDETTGHDSVASVTADQVASADAAYGVAILVSAVNVLSSDIVCWSILNSGTGTVVGVSAVAGSASIVFTFDADPQNDAVLSYSVFRAAV